MNTEKQEGTVILAHRFFTLGTIIGILFTAIAAMVGAWNSEATGLWPMVFVEIVIECMRNPEVPRGLCCLPIQIKAMWYPIVLFAIFMLFFGP